MSVRFEDKLTPETKKKLGLLPIEDKCKSVGGSLGNWKGNNYCYIPISLLDDVFHHGACKEIYDGFEIQDMNVCAIQAFKLNRESFSTDEKFTILKNRPLPPKTNEKSEANFKPGKPFLYEEYEVEGICSPWSAVTGDNSVTLIKHYHLNFEGDQEFFVKEIQGILNSSPKIKDKSYSFKKGCSIISVYPHLKGKYRIKIFTDMNTDASSYDYYIDNLYKETENLANKLAKELYPIALEKKGNNRMTDWKGKTI